MDGNHRRHLDWMPGSPWLRPDWRLRRAGYLLDTAGRFDRRIDDALVRSARAKIAEGLAQAEGACSCLSIVRAVYALSKLDHSTVRWRLEAYLLTHLSFDEIGATLGLSPEFVGMYHDLAYDVRPRTKATDWLTRFAMGRAASPNFEHVLKVCARSGGPKLLEVTIAIATGKSFPDWVRTTFAHPAFDDAVLRMRGLLAMGAILARTREQWRALVALRRRLRRLLRVRDDKREKRLNLMALQLVKFSPDGRTPRKLQALLATETASPETASSPATERPVRYQAIRDGEHAQPGHTTVANPEVLDPEIIEFMKEQMSKTGPYAFIHLNEETWSSTGEDSEPQVATVSIHVTD